MVTILTTLDLPNNTTNLGDPDTWGQQLNNAIRKLKIAIDAVNAGKSEPGDALTELIQDVVGAMFVPGAGASLSYDDVTGKLTVSAAGGGGSTDLEVVRDTIGATLKAGTGITLTVDDAGDTVTIAATGTGSGSGITQAAVGGYWSVSRRPHEITGLVAGADNTSKINGAIAAAQAYDTVVIPRGTWTHSGTIQHAKADVTVQGPATLVGTVPRYGGLHITGNGATVRRLTHRVDGATARGDGENNDDCPFSIDGATGVTLEDVVSIGSRDAQFFLFGAIGARLRNLVGRDSFADGLHISGASQDVVVDGVTITNPGDDGVAVISYVIDSGPCKGIRVSHAKVVNSDARAFSVAGGEDIVYSDIDVHRSRGSGYYVAHEQGRFNTRPVTGVRMIGGTALDTNWDPSLDIGAIGIFNLVAGTVMTDVVLQGLLLQEMRKNTPDGGTYCKVGNLLGSGGTFSGVRLQDITMQGGTAGHGLFVDRATTAALKVGAHTYVSSTTANGFAPTAEGFAGNGFTATRVRNGGRWAAMGA